MHRSVRMRDDRGATAIEYALIASLIAVVVVAGVALFASSVLDRFTDSNDAIAVAMGEATPTPTPTSTPTATATPTATPTPTSSAPAAAPLNVNLAAAEYITEYATRVRSGSNWKWECPAPSSAYQPVAPETSKIEEAGPAPVCIPK